MYVEMLDNGIGMEFPRDMPYNDAVRVTRAAILRYPDARSVVITPCANGGWWVTAIRYGKRDTTFRIGRKDI